MHILTHTQFRKFLKIPLRFISAPQEQQAFLIIEPAHKNISLNLRINKTKPREKQKKTRILIYEHRVISMLYCQAG